MPPDEKAKNASISKWNGIVSNISISISDRSLLMYYKLNRLEMGCLGDFFITNVKQSNACSLEVDESSQLTVSEHNLGIMWPSSSKVPI